MLTTSAAPGITDRTGAAHDEQRVLVDLQRGIVDPRVVVLRTVEHDGASLERLRIVRDRTDSARGTSSRDDAGLHDGASRTDCRAARAKPASSFSGRSKRRITSLVLDLRASRQFSPMVRPLTVSALSSNQPAAHQFSDTTAGTPPAR